jgi:hypothetical protein
MSAETAQSVLTGCGLEDSSSIFSNGRESYVRLLCVSMCAVGTIELETAIHSLKIRLTENDIDSSSFSGAEYNPSVPISLHGMAIKAQHTCFSSIRNFKLKGAPHYKPEILGFDSRWGPLMVLGPTQEYSKVKGQPTSKTGILAAKYKPVVNEMWEPRGFTTLWFSTAC